MRILFCGGGTAGHISPSVAIAESLLSSDRDSSVAFVGRQSGKENKIITDLGYPIYTLEVYGLKRSFSPENIKNVYKTLKAERMAEQIIKDFKPDAVLGTGGYVSFPVLRAALKRNIPTFIHESNSAPGLVTRIIAKRCAMVFLGTKTTNKKLNELKNVILTGTPVRGAFGTIGRQKARRKLGLTEKDIYIVSFGGSIGAEKFNDVIVEFMKRFSSKDVRIKHTHGSGERFFENINNNHPELCKGFSGCKIVPYINDMPTVLSAADIAITRAGAATLSELSLCATASILVPSPNVSEDHQKRNAEIYQNRGAAIMLEENSLTYDTLREKIKILLKDKHKRLTLSKSIKELATPNASINILNEICKWTHKSNSAPI